MREDPSRLYIDYVISMYSKWNQYFYTSVGLPSYMTQAAEDGLLTIEESPPNHYKVSITELGKETAKQLVIIYHL